MKRIALSLLASGLAATALLSGTAAASGPAPPGRTDGAHAAGSGLSPQDRYRARLNIGGPPDAGRRS